MTALLGWARQPVDAASLAVFRVCFGAIALWEVFRYFDAGWITSLWVSPTFHFHYVGFGWVHPLGEFGMNLVWAALGVSAAGIMLGALYRVSTIIFALGFGYSFLLETTTYLNHFYFLELVAILLVFVPAHRIWSVDAWLNRRFDVDPAPAWALWILRFQIAVLYVGGGIAKINSDWLHGQPIGMWLADRTDFPLVGQWFDAPSAGLIAAWSGMFFDLFIVFAVAWRRTRILALLAALAFHFTNSQLFNIGVFPFIALLCLLIFCEPDWPRALVRFLQNRTWTPRTFEAPEPLAGRRLTIAKAGLALGVLFAAGQVLIPLRHFAMPGNTSWTEAGHNFSWHMKLRDKSGETVFVVVDPKTRDGYVIRPTQDMLELPEEQLTNWQYDAMSVRPELIRQYAHHLADNAVRKGQPRPRVYVRSKVSLNGRPPQPMINPKVDLAAEPATLGTPSWVVPLRSPLPPRDKLYNP